MFVYRLSPPLSLPFPRYFFPKQRACSQAIVRDPKHQICTHRQTYLESIQLTIYHARESSTSLFHSIFSGAAPLKLNKNIMCDHFRVGLGPLFKARPNWGQVQSLRYEANFFNSRLNKIHLFVQVFTCSYWKKTVLYVETDVGEFLRLSGEHAWIMHNSSLKQP